MKTTYQVAIAWFSVLLFAVSGLILSFIADGTAGAGDSPMHYQYARYAPLHPELFFHHWAKPFFVWLASMPAQYGMIGIKIFNLTISVLSMLMTWRVAILLRIPNAGLVPLFMAFMPAFIHHSLSGYTEPLFALVTISGIWLYLNRQITLSILLISFLPFVRSEGLLICGVFGFVLLIEKNWFKIPLLAAGHLVYGVLGLKYHESVFWVFTKVPYARLSSVYGIGTWGHFFKELRAITGIPLAILLVIGVIYLLFKTCHLLSQRKGRVEWLLVLGSAGAYFIAHVIFWALGIFNSMGLLRVLIAIVPLMAIIQLRGFNTIVDILTLPRAKVIVAALLLFYVLIFPFSSNPYAWNYKRDFCRNEEQQLSKQVTDYIKSNFPDYNKYIYFFDANFVSVDMELDFFNDQKCMRTFQRHHFSVGLSFVIWDDWYSKEQEHVLLQELESDTLLKKVKEFTVLEPWGTERKMVLYTLH